MYEKEIKKNDINHINTKKVLNIFKKTLNVKLNSLKDKKLIKQLKLNYHPKWDSLAHSKLLNNIEKNFKIKIDERNITNFSTFESTLWYINKI